MALLRTSAESETRTLTIVGAVFVLCIILAGVFIRFNPFSGWTDNHLSVSINTPYAAPGVGKGTAVSMHGVQVGEVAAVTSLPGGGLLLETKLQKTPVTGLTDTVNIDFRPANYFGVSTVNLTEGTGGRPLQDGITITSAPKGNFSMQALMSHVNELSGGVLTPRLIEVIEKATRYTDALNPLIETMVITANAITTVQTVTTAQLLANATSIGVAMPSLVTAATDLGNALTDNDIKTMPVELVEAQFLPLVDTILDALFGTIGRLEGSHIDELLPAVTAVKSMTDVVPALISPDGIAETLVELRRRFEKMWGGTPEQRALQVRIILDRLPGVAAPLGLSGGPQ